MVFDVVNVLVAFDTRRILEEAFPGNREKHAELLDKVFHSPSWIMLDRGTLSLTRPRTPWRAMDQVPAAGHPLSAGTPGHPEASIPEGVETLRLCKAGASAA